MPRISSGECSNEWGEGGAVEVKRRASITHELCTLCDPRPSLLVGAHPGIKMFLQAAPEARMQQKRLSHCLSVCVSVLFLALERFQGRGG